jgi:hypothetical protein
MKLDRVLGAVGQFVGGRMVDRAEIKEIKAPMGTMKFEIVAIRS